MKRYNKSWGQEAALAAFALFCMALAARGAFELAVAVLG